MDLNTFIKKIKKKIDNFMTITNEHKEKNMKIHSQNYHAQTFNKRLPGFYLKKCFLI